jgi:hypothetical protein
MLTGLNVLSTWTPNLLMALGAESAFALRSNTVMMAVGLGAALLGKSHTTSVCGYSFIDLVLFLRHACNWPQACEAGCGVSPTQQYAC